MKKRMISLIMAMVMILSLCTVTFATETTNTLGLPAGTTEVSGPANVTAFTVNGDAASFQTDAGSSTVYARVIDNGGSEYALKNAVLEIRSEADLAVTVKDSAEADVPVSTTVDEDTYENVYTVTVNLFNKIATVTIDSDSYVVAAGLPEGTVDIDANDPLAVNGAIIGGATGIVTATNVQNPYIGNVAKSGEAGWTFVNYKIDASMTSIPESRASIGVGLNLASGAVASGCYANGTMNLSKASPKLVVTNNGESRNYYVFATDPGTVSVNFGFDFTEAKASTYYTGDVKDAVDLLSEQAAEFFGGNGYGTIVVASGKTVMDVMHDFASEYFYDDEVPEGCTYMATLNGIGEFTFGPMSGWMYTDGPSWDGNGNALYTTWNTPPIGAASYTLTAGDTICWFICCDYTHHPWN